jgi:hypothetical protein
MLEFLKVAIKQDKEQFKQWLKANTKYMFSESLFSIDINE